MTAQQQSPAWISGRSRVVEKKREGGGMEISSGAQRKERRLSGLEVMMSEEPYKVQLLWSGFNEAPHRCTCVCSLSCDTLQIRRGDVPKLPDSKWVGEDLCSISGEMGQPYSNVIKNNNQELAWRFSMRSWIWSVFTVRCREHPQLHQLLS